jgi:hypothetical protein
MTVPLGHMVLYDRIDPGLPQGEYRLRVETTVALTGADLRADTRYFNVEGPRFALASTEVAGVFPPRNGHGPFSDALPHVALGRRTLPWERSLDPMGRLPAPPVRAPGDPPAPSGAPPWMALLVFEEPELGTVLRDVAVTDVLPAGIAADLAVPAAARCDAIEISRPLLNDLLPTVEELSILSHVREVNVEDRELSAGDSDGWFAVIMSNRIPQPGKKYRACLVSLEGRTDVLRVTPPEVDTGLSGPGDVIGDVGSGGFELPSNAVGSGGGAAVAGAIAIATGPGLKFVPEFVVRPPPVRLVLLHSWAFEAMGVASFEELAQRVDVGMFSETRREFPVVADTGHLAVVLRDRAGAAQTAWYRGPLAPYAITRDALGPYHSADQCRRVSPDTGMEDISYAAAFEVGRLLAASDARLAQELMRWRRVDYRRSLEGSLGRSLTERFPGLSEIATERLPRVASELVQRWIQPEVPRIDPLELDKVRAAPGFAPERVAEAWAIAPERASAMLDRDLAVLRAPVDRADAAPAGAEAVTLDGVRADAAALERLAQARGRVR